MSDKIASLHCFLFKNCMLMELNAQTVKWFKLADEQLDPLMSLGALTLSVKHRFHCCRLFAVFPCDCVRVRLRDATGPVSLD